MSRFFNTRCDPARQITRAMAHSNAGPDGTIANRACSMHTQRLSHWTHRSWTTLPCIERRIYAMDCHGLSETGTAKETGTGRANRLKHLKQES
jgi:hypothetical protein